MMPSRLLVMSVAAAVGAAVAASAGPAMAQIPPTCDVQVKLEGAVWRAATPDKRGVITLCLQRSGGRWDPFVTGSGFNAAGHDGWVVDSSTDANGTETVRVLMRIRGDLWGEDNACAEYVLRLTAEDAKAGVSPQGRGAVGGTWSGTVRAHAARGQLSGAIEPVLAAAGWQRPAKDEHPHLLVRKADLPALREKAKTPWGQAWLEKLRTDTANPVAQGMAYALTGEAELAANARRRIEQAIDAHEWYHIGIAHAAAFTAMEQAIAYDLIHDACDEAFHRRMAEFLADKMDMYYWGAGNSQFNPSPTSNWSLMYRSGCGLVSLTRLDAPWSEPAAAARPMLTKLSPSAAAAPSPPVEPNSITAWAYAGPLEQSRLAAEPRGLEYQLLPARMMKNGAVDLAALTKRTFCRAVYLRCAVKVAQAGCYRFVAGGDRKLRYIAASLGEQPIRSGEFVQLAAGEYPLAVRLWPEPVGNWEPLTFSARLAPASGEQAERWLADRTAEWEFEGKFAAAEKAGAEKLGSNPQAVRWARLSAASAEGYFRRGLGEHGWNQEGEAYTRHAMRAGMPFAMCYRNAMGRDIGGAERVGMMLALATAATVFSDSGAAMQSYNVGGGPMDADLFARGWAFVPPRLGPGVLWSWNRTLALAEAGKLKDPHGVIAAHDGLSAAMMLLAWPAGAAERNPGEVMDRLTVDVQKGGYVFRNRWQDGNDCVVSLFANDNQAGGSWTSAEGGTFRIDALGAAWAVRGQGYGNGASGRSLADLCLYQNMVDVAEHDITASPQAKTTHFEAGKDGGGTVSLDMDEIYVHAEKEKVVKGGREEWRPTGRRDLGIRAVRALAVDYSGRCGAPCLVAVADRLTGTRGSNTWQMSTPREHAVTCETPAADAGPATFTITAGNGATLRGTVVAPAGAAVRVVEAEQKHEVNYHGRHSQAKFPRRMVLVDGKDKDQDFLVLMTIQKGPAPAVKPAGAGEASVGGQMVRFDGKKIVLGR